MFWLGCVVGFLVCGLIVMALVVDEIANEHKLGQPKASPYRVPHITE